MIQTIHATLVGQKIVLEQVGIIAGQIITIKDIFMQKEQEV